MAFPPTRCKQETAAVLVPITARSCEQGGALAGQKESSNMVLAPRGVRDVPAEEFIKAYADHLKTNDKVRRD